MPRIIDHGCKHIGKGGLSDGLKCSRRPGHAGNHYHTIATQKVAITLRLSCGCVIMVESRNTTTEGTWRVYCIDRPTQTGGLTLSLIPGVGWVEDFDEAKRATRILA